MLPGLLALTSCRGEQSTFAGAGAEALAVEALFWWMLAGAVLIWLFVIGLSVYATVVHPDRHGEKSGIRLIVWGGCAFPVVTLAGLLAFGLGLMPELRAEANGPRIAVSGERFWWRIHYGTEALPGVQRSLPLEGVESANELWLPVGRRTELMLGSPDVVHSFWVPAIAGKTDMIPGRINRLVLEPTREGVFNGVCAEFCGTAHAQMGFRVRVVSPEAFEAHVAAQAAPAAVPDHPGRAAFMQNGCAACHAVRGTEAAGRLGPDLTHVGSRRTLGAGLMAMNADNLARFIASPEHEKPGAEMPGFAMLPQAEIEAIALWLEALQ
ncbi:cytochrome c oxidase subunit II [Aureimonas populi]|uniref:C-type cytochrome n=1 Tax=Aureimonas populi TaxID=1701758 RepID=A0ABW5CNY3_9HYPH|nr:c-type cytochrome [Aureimonas populi]